MPPDDIVEPEWLDTDQLRLWKAIAAMLVTLPAALDAQLRRHAQMNLFEYHVLVALDDAPGRTMSMTELALLAQGSPSRLSHAVSRLERAGLAERVAVGSTGRRKSARLTDAGLDRLRRTAPGHVAEVRRLVLDVVSDDEFRSTGDIATRIVGRAAPDVAAVLEGARPPRALAGDDDRPSCGPGMTVD